MAARLPGMLEFFFVDGWGTVSEDGVVLEYCCGSGDDVRVQVGQYSIRRVGECSEVAGESLMVSVSDRWFHGAVVVWSCVAGL